MYVRMYVRACVRACVGTCVRAYACKRITTSSSTWWCFGGKLCTTLFPGLDPLILAYMTQYLPPSSRFMPGVPNMWTKKSSNRFASWLLMNCRDTYRLCFSEISPVPSWVSAFHIGRNVICMLQNTFPRRLADTHIIPWFIVQNTLT